MNRILFVEDDDLIARVYTQKLSDAGFEVSRAEDGLAAMKRLTHHVPDLVILDLLMPKFSGVDVLKFMRRQAALKAVRVVVFSNSFLGGLIEQVGTTGVERVVVKSSVKPDELVRIVREVIEEPIHPHRDPPAPSLTTPQGTLSRSTDLRKTETPAGATPLARSAPAIARENPAEFRARMRQEFAKTGPLALSGLRELFSQFLETSEQTRQAVRLGEVHRKVRFLSHMASSADFDDMSRLGAALEALVFELQEKPRLINDSTRQTIASSIGLLVELFKRRENRSDHVSAEPPRVLVVDDDAVTNRALVLALARMPLRAVGVTDPAEALNRLRDQPFNVVLLDIELPGMDGLALCDKMRALPGHRLTPVIFVTSHDDFRTRARSLMIGSTDFIAKPVIPVELGVKVVALLLARPT
jgi:CheY-like chemotaxis protein